MLVLNAKCSKPSHAFWHQLQTHILGCFCFFGFALLFMARRHHTMNRTNKSPFFLRLCLFIQVFFFFSSKTNVKNRVWIWYSRLQLFFLNITQTNVQKAATIELYLLLPFVTPPRKSSPIHYTKSNQNIFFTLQIISKVMILYLVLLSAVTNNSHCIFTSVKWLLW